MPVISATFIVWVLWFKNTNNKCPIRPGFGQYQHSMFRRTIRKGEWIFCRQIRFRFSQYISRPMELVFATNNKHKLKEVAQILPKRIRLLNLADIGCMDELPETGNTFEENALQKAQYV